MKKKENTKPQVCVDVTKFSYTCDHLNNQIDYSLGYSEKPIEEMVKEDAKNWSNISYVCFSGYGGYVNSFKTSNKKPPNRLHFKLTVHEAAMNLLNDEERERWIVLSKMHGLLPPYIKEDAIDKCDEDSKKIPKNLCGHFFIDIDKIPASLLYVYLSTLRNLREDPGLPKVVIHLVDDIGMNFYGAYVFGSRIAIVSTGHHILEIFRPYGERYRNDKEAAEKISTSLTASVRLANCIRRFVHEPGKYDIRKATDNCRLTASPIISPITHTGYDHNLTLSQFMDEDVVRAIMSLTDKDFDKHMKSFKDKQPKAVLEAVANGQK